MPGGRAKSDLGNLSNGCQVPDFTRADRTHIDESKEPSGPATCSSVDLEANTVKPHLETRDRLLRWWGWLLLTTLLLLLLVTSRYFGVAELDARPAALMFRATMLVAHFTTVASVALLPALLGILLWPRPRILIPLGVLCGATTVAVVLIDTQVYQLYRFHINAGVLNLLMSGAAGETFVFSTAMYAQGALIAAAILATFVGAACWSWRRVHASPRRRTLPRAVTSVLVAALISFHSVHIWADAVGYEPLLEQTEVLPMRYAATAKRLLRAHGVNLSAMQAMHLRDSRASTRLSYPLTPLTCRATEKPPNIVVIVIDSWRFDELNAKVTPNIDAFARRSARFVDHYSGGNATRIGIFSLFYSIPGTYWHRVLAEQQRPVLIEELSRLKYDVQVFRSAPLYSPEFDRTVFAQVEGVRMRSDGKSPAEWDRDLTSDFLGYLDARPAAPFFALLFYDAPHSFDHPEDYPAIFEPEVDHVNYFQLHSDTDALPLLNRYRNSLHYVDSLAGKAFAALESRGLLENSVIIVTGDHGQEFNDNHQNYWGHASNFTRFQTGVPLLLYAPQLTPKVYPHRTTHFDVMPTVMRDYLGCDDPFSTYSVGHSLFEPGGREVVVMSEYADFAIMHDDRMAIVRKHGMKLRDQDYVEVDGQLAPEVVAAALEQKMRFVNGARAGTEGGGSKRAGCPVVRGCAAR
jgi:membrane-anchored protein YejM (alkaline phosphatase superfamily)